jgi:hypothetical protein
LVLRAEVRISVLSVAEAALVFCQHPSIRTLRREGSPAGHSATSAIARRQLLGGRASLPESVVAQICRLAFARPSGR